MKRPSPTLKRYVGIGLSVYAFELVVIVIAQNRGASPVAAVALSFWLGLLVSFGLQKMVTFSDKRLHHKVLVPQILAYSALVLFNFGFTLAFTNVLQNIIPAVMCRTLAIGMTTLWNFYLYKTHIFKNPGLFS